LLLVVVAVLGTMPILVMDRHQPVQQQVVIPVATPVVVLVVLMVAEEINIVMVLVALVGVEMGLMVILLLEAKALPMAHKAVLAIRLVMALMVDLAVAVDPTLAAAAAVAIQEAEEVIGLTPVMAVAADPISRIRPQIQAVRQEKMKVMVRSSLPIALVSALNLPQWWPITVTWILPLLQEPITLMAAAVPWKLPTFP